MILFPVMKVGAKYFTLVLSFAFLCSKATAFEYEVCGTMAVNTADHPPFKTQMQVFVRDDQWAIFQYFHMASSPTNRMVTELCSDGKSITWVRHFEVASESAGPDKEYGWQSLSNSWSAKIYPAGFPAGADDPGSAGNILLFYAYASAGCLDSTKNQMISPVAFHRTGRLVDDDLMVNAVWKRDLAAPRLPDQIWFLNGYGSPGFLAQPLPVCTNAQLNSTQFVDVGGVHIPVKVSLVFSKNQTYAAQSRYEFVATVVSRKCPLKNFSASYPANAWVSHYRAFLWQTPAIEEDFPAHIIGSDGPMGW